MDDQARVFIDNAELAGGIADRLFTGLPSFAYQVTENEKGKLRWTALIDGEEVVETTEPQASAWLRFKAFLSRILPEGQL